MKLSLRLMAERGRDDRLGYYLDDPIQLFVPARLLLGLIFSLATVLLAVVTGRSGINFASLATLLACVAVYIILCEHVLPSIIVRRNPEAVLAALLPPFSVIARADVADLRRARPPAHQRPARARRRPAGAGRRRPGRSRARLSRGRRRAGADRGRRAPAAAVDRRFRRHARARSHDAAPRHRRDPGGTRPWRSCARCSASRSTRGSRSTRRISTTSSASSA